MTWFQIHMLVAAWQVHALLPSEVHGVLAFISHAPRPRQPRRLKFLSSTSGDDEHPGLSPDIAHSKLGKNKFKPRAPKIPPPPADDEDDCIISEANELMKIQRAMRMASLSPTYVIPRRDPTITMIIPEKEDCLGPEPSVLETASALSSNAEFLRLYQTRPFRTMELLNDSRMRAKKRLSRSDFEKNKAAEKKAQIKAQLQAQLLEIDNNLKEKMASAQNAIEKEVENMRDLIVKEISLESKRGSQFLLLIDNLQKSIKAITKDIASEKKITKEMRELRSRLKDSSSSTSQLDKLIVQKEDLLSVEKKMLHDLNQCIVESRQTLHDCEKRAHKMKNVLTKIDTLSLDACWSDIDEIEIVLNEAANDVSASEARVASLRERIAQTLIEKDAILKSDANEEKGYNDWNSGGSVVVKLSELQEWNDTEVFKQFAISLGNATFSGSKAAVFAIKTFIEAASNEKVTLNAEQARQKSKIIGAASNETFKEATKSALDAYVDTAKAYFETASSIDTGKRANSNLHDAKKELKTVANAIGALGIRVFHKMKGRK